MSDELVGKLRSLTNGDKVKIGSNKPFVMKEMTPYPTSHTIYGIVTDTEVGLGGIRMFQLREIELDVIGSAAGTALTIEKAVGEDNLDETSMGKFISSIGSADHVFGSGGGVRKKIKKRRTKRRRTKRRRTKRR